MFWNESIELINIVKVKETVEFASFSYWKLSDFLEDVECASISYWNFID